MNLVQILAALGQVLLLAILLERAFSVLFESHYYVKTLARWRIKEFITFVASVFVCHYYEIDLMKVIAGTNESTVLGIVITAAILTGLTKASTKLFRDFLAFRSEAYIEYINPSRPRPVEKQQEPRHEPRETQENDKGESIGSAPSWYAQKIIEAIIKILVAVISAALLILLGLRS